jgi:hypothetical protein
MTGLDRSDDDDPVSEDDGVIRAEFDWSSRAPSRAVVETVAIAENAEPTAIEPLYDSVDPDALDALVRSNGRNPKNGDVTVTFTLDGCKVQVRSDGVVIVHPVATRP